MDLVQKIDKESEESLMCDMTTQTITRQQLKSIGKVNYELLEDRYAFCCSFYSDVNVAEAEAAHVVKKSQPVVQEISAFADESAFADVEMKNEDDDLYDEDEGVQTSAEVLE